MNAMNLGVFPTWQRSYTPSVAGTATVMRQLQFLHEYLRVVLLYPTLTMTTTVRTLVHHNQY